MLLDNRSMSIAVAGSPACGELADAVAPASLTLSIAASTAAVRASPGGGAAPGRASGPAGAAGLSGSAAGLSGAAAPEGSAPRLPGVRRRGLPAPDARCLGAFSSMTVLLWHTWPDPGSTLWTY